MNVEQAAAELIRAQELVGPPQVTHQDVRDYVEGRRKHLYRRQLT